MTRLPVPAQWSWMELYQDGDDLVILNADCTAFGGDSDPEDNGETACGYNTKGHPDLLGCAIPMRVDTLHSLCGSPIPHMPFGMFANGKLNPHGARVIVSDPATGRLTPPLPVVDLGPSGYTKHACDLTEAAARILTPGASARNFERTLTVRILGAAKFLAA